MDRATDRRHAVRNLVVVSEPVAALVYVEGDFLDPDLPVVEAHVERLGVHLQAGTTPGFEISTTTHSVYRHDDAAQANLGRARSLVRLRRLGLEKIYLDVGSGSDTQLHRYGKAHSAEESAAAADRIRAAGLRLEIGFQMFDPLCTVEEVAENAMFIRRAGIAGDLCSLADELPLQRGSLYLKVVERRERAAGRLHWRPVDLDTLTHPYGYASADVARLVSGIRPAAEALQVVSCPISYASRLSEGTPAAADQLSAVLARWKGATLCAIEAGIHAVNGGQDPQAAAEEAMVEAGWSLAADLIGAHRRLPPSLQEHPRLVAAVQRSREFIDNPLGVIAAYRSRRPPEPSIAFRPEETASDA